MDQIGHVLGKKKAYFQQLVALQDELGSLDEHPLFLQLRALETKQEAAWEDLDRVFTCRPALRRWKKAVDQDASLACGVPLSTLRQLAKDPLSVLLAGPEGFDTVARALQVLGGLVKRRAIPLKRTTVDRVLQDIEKVATPGVLAPLMARYHVARKGLEDHGQNPQFLRLQTRRAEIEREIPRLQNDIEVADQEITSLERQRARVEFERQQRRAWLRHRRSARNFRAVFRAAALALVIIGVTCAVVFFPVKSNPVQDTGGGSGLPPPPQGQVRIYLGAGFLVGIAPDPPQFQQPSHSTPHEHVAPSHISINAGGTPIPLEGYVTVPFGTAVGFNLEYQVDGETYHATRSWTVESYQVDGSEITLREGYCVPGPGWVDRVVYEDADGTSSI